MLGQPYGTGEWQPHDHESQNNIFKLNLQRAKTTLIEKKRAAGLLGEIEEEEIILIIAPLRKQHKCHLQMSLTLDLH